MFQLLLCSIVMQNIQILYWVPVMFVVAYLWVALVKIWAWSFRSWNSEICWISREWIDKLNRFFACCYKFRKANVNLVIVGWTWSKMGSYKVYIIWDSHIICISHIIWLIKQIDSIIFGLTSNLLCIFGICWVSAAFVFIKNVLL